MTDTLPDLDAYSLVDHKCDRDAIVLLVIVEHRLADAGEKEAETAVIGAQAISGFAKGITVERILGECRDRGFALQSAYTMNTNAGDNRDGGRVKDRTQTFFAGDRVADECESPGPLFRAFVDQEDGPAVEHPIAFQHRDPRGGETFLVIKLIQLAAGLFDGKRIGRVARFDPGFLFQRLLVDSRASDKQDLR